MIISYTIGCSLFFHIKKLFVFLNSKQHLIALQNIM
jgi:hypothetical protein